jgi:hypothetical protein
MIVAHTMLPANSFPTTGSGNSGVVKKGDFMVYFCSWCIRGKSVKVGASFRALIDMSCTSIYKLHF